MVAGAFYHWGRCLAKSLSSGKRLPTPFNAAISFDAFAPHDLFLK